MDPETLRAYNANAAAFAQEWHAQPPPGDLHAIVQRFCKPGPTADVGCGSGRDVAWLAANGFPAVGYDPSPGLLAEAQRRYPDLAFHAPALPELEGLSDYSFTNVLCETVIMHLAVETIAPAVHRLMSILEPGGILYLSWHVTGGAGRRDSRGRLYAALTPETVREALAGAVLLLDESVSSASSRQTVHRLVARKPDPG